MSSKLSGVIIVNATQWDNPEFSSKWEGILDKVLLHYKVFILSHRDKSGIKKVVKFLNASNSSQVILIDTQKISPDDLVEFLKSSEQINSEIIFQGHSGHVSPYSHIKILSHSLCYNIRPSDISFGSDQSILHLASQMSLTIGTIDAKKISSFHHLFHSFFAKLVNNFSPARPYHIESKSSENMLGAGMVHHGQTYITHSTLKDHRSSANTFTLTQCLIAFSVAFTILLGLFAYPTNTMIAFTAILSSIYFIDVLFNLFLVGKSLNSPPELSFTDEEVAKLKDRDLPVYSILVPLYKEANILAGFVDSISKMDYPKSKLDIILLLEEDDQETVDVAKSLNLPRYIRSVVVPHSSPKTKPKACNYGLAFARGEYIVIYDAEDHPDPLQLKKAILGFKASPPEVACLQAKLNYHNPHQNLLTRFFTAEYSLWFDVVLPGLQSINTTIPLGGTSNHFRTKDIIRFQGWDAFNVTEDADLGTRLFKAGFMTAIIDSVTLEEANSKVGNWIRQRSRWIKGYMQTYLVHNRDLGEFIQEQGWHAVIFQLTVGGKIAFMLINPLLWIATISYFVLYRYVGPTIESFYPTPVFYMAAFSLVFGNFLYIYYYMIGIAKHGHWSLVKYVFLVPLYWLLISRSALKALYQLLVNPHYWEKTVHGLNLKKVVGIKVVAKKEAKKRNHSIQIFLLTKAVLLLDAIQNIAEEGLSKPSFLSKVIDFIKSVYNHPLSGSVILVIASVIGNFLNFLYSVYLGNTISLEQFGLISLFGSFTYLTQIPFSVFSSSVTQQSAYRFGKDNNPPKYIWRQYRRWAFNLSLGLTLVWLVTMPWLRSVFKGDSLLPFIFFTPVWVIGLLSAVDGGFLSGIHRFKVIAVLGISEAMAKFLFTVLFVVLNQRQNVYLALPLSMSISFLIAWLYANSTPEQKLHPAIEEKIKFPIKFANTVILNKISFVAFLGLDIIIAKIVLSPQDAGLFALVSLVGKMVYFFSSLAGGFILPMVSKEDGASGNPKKIFHKIFLVTLFFTAISYVSLGTFGRILVPLLFGSKMLVVIKFLPFYLLGIASFTLANSIITYHQSRKNYTLSLVSFAITITQLFVLIDVSRSINTFTFILGSFGIVQLLIVSIFHRLTRYSVAISQNTFAFFNLFKKQKNNSPKFEGQIRFLILNWRDTKHKWAGGAEVYVHELAKNLVDKGHQVTLFCGNDGSSKNSEVIDGVSVIRRGGFFTVYVWAAIYYVLKFQDRFDIIIDSENGIPFFTPLYSRRPKFLLIHHVHQDFFRENLTFPALQISCFLEKYIMPRVYSREKVVTVSESSLRDVLKLGIFKEENICIVNPGVEVVDDGTSIAKTEDPSLLYLGRLKSYKNVDIAIKAFSQVIKKLPKAKFHIAGEGDCDGELKTLVEKLNLQDSVVFHGRVDEEKTKPKLLKQSWIMVQPSSFEGWGITVIEANLFGTPVVASDIPGLRDSVVNGETGILVKPKNITDFAEAITKICKNKNLRTRMSLTGIERAKKFNWSENTDIFLSAIHRYYLNLNQNQND